MDLSRLFSQRSANVRESVIRRVFEEGRAVHDPIDFSIGQPDFAVPEPIKRAAIRAIEQDRNGYGPNRGVDPLLAKIAEHLKRDIGWDAAVRADPSRPQIVVTMGTSGALICAAMALLDPGDEVIIPDPYFVLYPRLAELTGATAVTCDTYPDFRMTAARVEPLITPRTKAALIDSPSNPCGVVLTDAECRDLVDLCRRRGVLLISDEIYDEFTYPESRTAKRPRADARGDEACCPSPCRFPGAQECTLLVRGFGKTYGPTGWRLGYCVGPAPLMDRMVRMQQHLYISAPTPLQYAAVEAFNVDMTVLIDRFRARRDLVHGRLSEVTEVPMPGGAFYAFVRVPDRLRMTASQFKDAARARKVLVVPGTAFSSRDTHFRLSYAVDDAKLARGLDILVELLRG